MSVTYTMMLTHMPWEWFDIDTTGSPNLPDNVLQNPSSPEYIELKMEIEKYVRTAIQKIEIRVSDDYSSFYLFPSRSMRKSG